MNSILLQAIFTLFYLSSEYKDFRNHYFVTIKTLDNRQTISLYHSEVSKYISKNYNVGDTLDYCEIVNKFNNR